MKTCITCLHESVCKYKDECQKYLKTPEGAPEFMKVEYECKYYYYDPASAFQAPGVRGALTVSQQDTCGDCEFYKTTIKAGKLYVGDSPCQWCSKSPIISTVSTSTSKSINDTQL